MKIKVRRAKVSDVRQLQEKLFKLYEIQKDIGAKDIAKDNDVLWGGSTIEIGTGFNNPNWHCVVADRDGELIAFLVGILEYCSPVAEDMRAVKIHANYLENDSLIGPRVLMSMWGLMEDWAKENGAGHFYANIHPGNQPSIRAAKKIGFKHHYTQFYRPLEMEAVEE
jgi:hypothetical protein